LPRGLQVLADGEKVDVGAAQVIHDLQHLLPALAEPDHDARLGEHRRIELLHPLKESQRVEVARTGPNLQVKTGDGLQVVIEHIRPRLDDHLQRTILAEEVRGEDLYSGPRRSGTN